MNHQRWNHEAYLHVSTRFLPGEQTIWVVRNTAEESALWFLGLNGDEEVGSGEGLFSLCLADRQMGSRPSVNASGRSLHGPREKQGSQTPFVFHLCSPGNQKRRRYGHLAWLGPTHLRGTFSSHSAPSFVHTSSKIWHVGQLWLNLARVAGGWGVEDATLAGTEAAERTNRTVEKWEGVLWRAGTQNRLFLFQEEENLAEWL